MINPSIYGVSEKRGGRILDNVRSQIRAIRKGGGRTLLWKVYLLLGMGLAIFPLLLVRLLRPLVTFRFASLYSHSIGPFALTTENYLCERDAGMHGGRVIDLFSYQPPVCNQQLKKMWGRTIRVSQLIYPLDKLNRLLPGGLKHTVPWREEDDIHGLLSKTSPRLSFTPQENTRGKVKLGELGVPDGVPFVCFNARDSAYLQELHRGADLTDRDYRDSSIENYIPAAEALVERGYFALRMGAIVKEPLPATHPNIIDYATVGRTDFLDVYLSSKCSFFICSSTGLRGLPVLFRRPIVLVNLDPLDSCDTWHPGQLIIPKKLWSCDDRRYLTFGETLQLERAMLAENLRLRFGLQYAERGIEVIENTAEEIAAVVLEMDERLKGTWETTEEDEVLQDRFWSVFERERWKSDEIGLTRIGVEFLRQNQDLLEQVRAS